MFSSILFHNYQSITTITWILFALVRKWGKQKGELRWQHVQCAQTTNQNMWSDK